MLVSVVNEVNKPDAHCSVLLAEAIAGLAIKPDGIYVDATFGRGGHSRAILEQLGPQGRLIAIDKDNAAIAFAKENFNDPRFQIHQGSFVQLPDLLSQLHLAGKVDGILFDLGVSSPQLDDASRGFSFMRDGPLDMRMDQSQGITAREWLAECTEQELVKVLFDFGEERFARRIARAVMREREQQPIDTTKQLADLITHVNPSHEPGKHPATRSFQGIRIFINNELQDLMACLEGCLESLTQGGRIAAISFHSLEDRIVKRFFRKQVKGDEFPAELPITPELIKPRMKIVERALKPSPDELQQNPRARSAVLRIAEKMA